MIPLIAGGLVGNSSMKRDRQETLSSFTDLHNVFNFGMSNATAQQGAGAANLNKAGDYYSKLLSGNRPATLQAIAPQTAAINEATDAQRRQQSTSGTARGGGTAVANQTAQDKKMAEIDNLLFGARTDAAKGAERVGQAQVSDAASLLGIGERSASDLGSLSIEAKGQQFQQNQATAKAVTEAIVQAMAAFA
jgi:hypothetical protein